MPKEGRGHRIGGRWFSEGEAERIVERCSSGGERIVDVAKELGLKYAALMMYVRRKRSPVEGGESGAREPGCESGRKRNAKQRRELEQRRLERGRVAMPLERRVMKGEWYYVPTEGKAGAYKVRETESKFDDEKFEAGLYFGTEEEASDFSFLRVKEREKNSKFKHKNRNRDGNKRQGS